MNEKEFAIVVSKKHNDLLKMKIVQKFKFSEYQSEAIPAWSYWKSKYKYCYIIETVYG